MVSGHGSHGCFTFGPDATSFGIPLVMGGWDDEKMSRIPMKYPMENPMKYPTKNFTISISPQHQYSEYILVYSSINIPSKNIPSLFHLGEHSPYKNAPPSIATAPVSSNPSQLSGFVGGTASRPCRCLDL